MKGLISIILIIFILLIAIAIGSQNDGLISINYLIAQSTIRISSFISIVLAIGVFIGVALFLPVYLRLKLQLASLKSKSKRLEKQV